MSDWQNDLLGCPSDNLSNSLTTMYTSSEFLHRKFFTNKFLNKLFKKFHCDLSKINLHNQTVIDQQVKSPSPTVQLDFSWTLKMSDRWKDLLTRSSECLSSSLSGKWNHLEAPSKLIYSKLMNFQINC